MNRRSFLENILKTNLFGAIGLASAKIARPVSARARNAVEDLNVQVIRSYSWAAAESPKNSQRKPVNNCGGSHKRKRALIRKVNTL